MGYGVMNTDEMNALGMELLEKTVRLAELRRAVTPQAVEDVELQGPDGPVILSALFGDKSDLILVHNMGKSCAYCHPVGGRVERAAGLPRGPGRVRGQQPRRAGRAGRVRRVARLGLPNGQRSVG